MYITKDQKVLREYSEYQLTHREALHSSLNAYIILYRIGSSTVKLGTRIKGPIPTIEVARAFDRDEGTQK